MVADGEKEWPSQLLGLVGNRPVLFLSQDFVGVDVLNTSALAAPPRKFRWLLTSFFPDSEIGSQFEIALKLSLIFEGIPYLSSPRNCLFLLLERGKEVG